MASNLTEVSLGIFWDGQEVDGVTAYAYLRGNPTVLPVFPVGLWPLGTRFKRGRLVGDDWSVILFDIAVGKWPTPDRWETILEETLRRLCDAGAKIAWFGLEGGFVDPPGLFDPQLMSGDVYAAYAPGLGFVNAAHLSRPFASLSNSRLEELRRLIDYRST